LADNNKNSTKNNSLFFIAVIFATTLQSTALFANTMSQPCANCSNLALTLTQSAATVSHVR